MQTVTAGPFGTLVLTRNAAGEIEQADLAAKQVQDFTDEIVRCVDFAAPSDYKFSVTDRAD